MCEPANDISIAGGAVERNENGNQETTRGRVLAETRLRFARAILSKTRLEYENSSDRRLL